MYPDRQDLDRVSKTILRSTGVPDFAETVLAWHFLEQSYQVCRNHGRRTPTEFSVLKQAAEKFTGRSVSDFAFATALVIGDYKRVPKTQWVDMDTLKNLKIQFPPTAKFDEAREQWKKHQTDVETEIAEELKIK